MKRCSRLLLLLFSFFHVVIDARPLSDSDDNSAHNLTRLIFRSHTHHTRLHHTSLNSNSSTELRFPKKRCRYSDHEFEYLNNNNNNKNATNRDRISRVNSVYQGDTEQGGQGGYYISNKAASGFKKHDPNQVKQPKTRDEFNNRHYNSSKKILFCIQYN
jgi:hypothetical protein